MTLESYTDIKNPLKTIFSRGKLYGKMLKPIQKKKKTQTLTHQIQICTYDFISTNGKDKREQKDAGKQSTVS